MLFVLVFYTREIISPFLLNYNVYRDLIAIPSTSLVVLHIHAYTYIHTA